MVVTWDPRAGGGTRLVEGGWEGANLKERGEGEGGGRYGVESGILGQEQLNRGVERQKAMRVELDESSAVRCAAAPMAGPRRRAKGVRWDRMGMLGMNGTGRTTHLLVQGQDETRQDRITRYSSRSNYHQGTGQ